MGRFKQVIVIRRDLNMRRGKEIAQGSHASMDFIVERVRNRLQSSHSAEVSIHFSEAEQNWISEGMAKIRGNDARDF
jgi:peptidyl-tRNA hydrolase, PTH2 family